MRTLQLLQENGVLEAQNPGYVADIGANIGTVCIPLATTGLFKGALAFEPDARNFAFLVQNIEQNGLSACIKALPVALSSKDGEGKLEKSPANFGDHRVRVSENRTAGDYAEGTREVVNVLVRSLETALSDAALNANDLALLWIDVQGHEWHVLQGAHSAMVKRVPIVMEVWPYGLRRAETDFSAFERLLCKHYNCFFDLKEASPARRDITQFGALLESLDGMGSEATTDILLIGAKN